MRLGARGRQQSGPSSVEAGTGAAALARDQEAYPSAVRAPKATLNADRLGGRASPQSWVSTAQILFPKRSALRGVLSLAL